MNRHDYIFKDQVATKQQNKQFNKIKKGIRNMVIFDFWKNLIDRLGHSLVSLWEIQVFHEGLVYTNEEIWQSLLKWRHPPKVCREKSETSFPREKPSAPVFPHFSGDYATVLTDVKQQLLLAIRHCCFQMNRCSSCWMSHLNEATMAYLQRGLCCSVVIRHDSPGTTFL